MTSSQQALSRGSGVNDHRTDFGIAGVHTEPLPLGGVWSCLSLGIQASAALWGMPNLPQKAGGQDPCVDARPGTCAGLSAAQAREGGLHPVPAACRAPAPLPPDGCQGSGARPGHPLVYVPGIRVQLGWRRAGQPLQTQVAGKQSLKRLSLNPHGRAPRGRVCGGRRSCRPGPLPPGLFLQCPNWTRCTAALREAEHCLPGMNFWPATPHCLNTGRGVGVHRGNQQEREEPSLINVSFEKATLGSKAEGLW